MRLLISNAAPKNSNRNIFQCFGKKFYNRTLTKKILVMKNLIFLFIPFFLISSLTNSQPIFWEQLSGPHGGAIYSIINDNAGNIYASALWGQGPYKSTDNGESWFSIKNGMTPGSQFCPMNISSNGNLFVAGAFNSDICVYRSTDGGNSWTPLDNLNTNQGSVMCISFDSYDNVYVGTGTGIYMSMDNGDTWSAYGMNDSGIAAIAFNDSGYVFAGTSYAVYRSIDNGATWDQLPTGGGTRTVTVAPNGFIFAGCWENAGILRSTDNGDSWEYVYPQTVSIKEASTVFFDDNGDIYFPTNGKGVLKSTDNGNTWTEMNNNLGYKYVNVVAKTSSGDFFTAGDYAIYRSTDGCTSWHSVGINISGVRKIAINSDDDIFATVWGVNRSTDSGQTWETIDNGIDNYDIRSIVVHDNGDIFVGASPVNWSINNLYRSSDNGESWLPVTGFPLNWDVSITGLALGPNGEIVAVGSGYDTRCHISTDVGLTWTDIRYNLNFGPGEVAINSSGDIFIMGGSQGIWRKLASDTVWTQVLTGNVDATLFIASNGNIYTTYSKSTDNGATWTENGMNTYVSSFAENSLGHLFCGTYNFGYGVYRSTDNGDTWEQINDGLTIMDIRSLGIDSEDYLYAGTWGKSMFKTTTSTVVGIHDASNQVSAVTIYPNPAKTQFKIQSFKFKIEKIEIVDLYGKVVKSYSGNFNSEKREFDVSHLPAGVYFINILSEVGFITRKIILSE